MRTYEKLYYRVICQKDLVLKTNFSLFSILIKQYLTKLKFSKSRLISARYIILLLLISREQCPIVFTVFKMQFILCVLNSTSKAERVYATLALHRMC